MIFIAGVYPKQKELEYDDRLNICPHCRKYGRYQAYMEYNAFSIFFIPIFKWKKRYFVLTSCCGERFELDQIVGERIEGGDFVEIRDCDLTHPNVYGGVGHCSNCGITMDPQFRYCPNCGAKQD